MRLAQVAAGALVGVAVLAGCSSGPAPANDTLPSAAPTSAEASETLPPLGPPDFPMPPEAREQTPAGAEAFLRYYLALIGRSSSQLDSQDMRRLSNACETCDRIAGEIDQDAAAGYVYEGGGIEITSSSSPAIMGDEAEVAFVADQQPLKLVDAAGEPVAGLDFPAQVGLSSGATMRWDPALSSWVMTQLTFG